MTKATAAELLDLIIAKAKELRDAGVERVELDTCAFSLATKELPAHIATGKDDDDPKTGWRDPSLYGLPDDHNAPRLGKDREPLRTDKKARRG